MSARERLAAALDGFSEFDWASLGTDELVSRMFADDPDLEAALELGLAWQKAVAALPEGFELKVVGKDSEVPKAKAVETQAVEKALRQWLAYAKAPKNPEMGGPDEPPTSQHWHDGYRQGWIAASTLMESTVMPALLASGEPVAHRHVPEYPSSCTGCEHLAFDLASRVPSASGEPVEGGRE